MFRIKYCVMRIAKSNLKIYAIGTIYPSGSQFCEYQDGQYRQNTTGATEKSKLAKFNPTKKLTTINPGGNFRMKGNLFSGSYLSEPF